MNREIDMRTSLLISVFVLLCAVIGAGPAAASWVDYPFGEYSEALDLGFGIAFIFNDTYYNDYWIHIVNYWADLLRVGLQTNTGAVPGYAFYLEFEHLGPYHHTASTVRRPVLVRLGGRRGTCTSRVGVGQCAGQERRPSTALPLPLGSAGLIVLGIRAVSPRKVPPSWVRPPGIRPSGGSVVIAPEKRSAILVLLDSERRDVGHMTLREGESISGYRVAGVEPDRVLLERGGRVFTVSVGRPRIGPTGALGVAGRRPVFIPGPDKPTPDLEFKRDETRRRQGGGSSGVPADAARSDPEATQDILQRMFGNPRVQQRVEESRPIIRQRLERERQERSQGVPADAAPASKPLPDTPGAGD